MLFSIFSMDVSFTEMMLTLLVLVLVCLISLTSHEFAHAYVASKQGDTTPKAQGRLTLNPFAHLDIIGFFSLMLCGIGWAKPVPINPSNFKKYREGIAKVSLAGVTANAILMGISCVLYAILVRYVVVINLFTELLILFFGLLMEFNAYLIIFNLIPIFPLDGFNFVSTFLPSNSKFISNSIKNSTRILLSIILIDLAIEIFTGFSILGFALGELASLLYGPLLKILSIVLV